MLDLDQSATRCGARVPAPELRVAIELTNVRRWCMSTVRGNRIKTRACRERRRDAGQERWLRAFVSSNLASPNLML